MRQLFSSVFFIMVATASQPGLASSDDPLFGNDKESRNRTIFKNIELRAEIIFKEYNKSKNLDGVKAQKAYINEKLELLFLGIDPESWSRRLSTKTGSLQKICYINSLMDSLEFMAIAEGKRFLHKEVAATLRIVSKRCSTPR
ncbi:hypothetical protein GW916_02850 [bacterium]|nr:hypothetical protein [bacterium]